MQDRLTQYFLVSPPQSSAHPAVFGWNNTVVARSVCSTTPAPRKNCSIDQTECISIEVWVWVLQMILSKFLKTFGGKKSQEKTLHLHFDQMKFHSVNKNFFLWRPLN